MDFIFKVPSPPERTCEAVYTLRELIDDPFKQKVIEAAVPDLYAKVRSLLTTIDTSSSPTVNARVYKHDLIDLIKKEQHERRKPFRYDHLYQLDQSVSKRKITTNDFDPVGLFGKDYPGLRGPGSR